MKQKILARILLGIAAFALLTLLCTKVVIEPWIGRRIQASVNENSGDYLLHIKKVHVSIFRSGIELENLTLHSKPNTEGQSGLTGKIESVHFKGIRLIKALFRKDIHIREVVVFNSQLKGKVAFAEKDGTARVSPVNIRIEHLVFDQLDVDVQSKFTAQAYFLKGDDIKIYDINVEKDDTLSAGIFGQLDFDVPEFSMVTSDSLYTFLCMGIRYSATSSALSADSFKIQPNYTEYEFAAQNQYETDRLKGRFSKLSFSDFSAVEFIKSGNIASSMVGIGEIELDVFRDKRKEFRHIKKPAFQDLIYDYPGHLNIDSLVILGGNIAYSEHAEHAVEMGSIWFNDIGATICKISNDESYKTEQAYLELHAEAMLMGKGKLAVLFKSRIFDPRNTFAVNGSLSGMDASALNPFLEKAAFIRITSGRIIDLDFNFSANNTKADGKLNLLYKGLAFETTDKQSKASPAAAQQVKLLIANIIVPESNPMPGEKVRPGKIEYERDPEKFLFSYFVKALMTGIKASFTNKKSAKKPKR